MAAVSVLGCRRSITPTQQATPFHLADWVYPDARQIAKLKGNVISTQSNGETSSTGEPVAGLYESPAEYAAVWEFYARKAGSTDRFVPSSGTVRSGGPVQFTFGASEGSKAEAANGTWVADDRPGILSDTFAYSDAGNFVVVNLSRANGEKATRIVVTTLLNGGTKTPGLRGT
jgi:hypothetical protein